MFEERSHDDVPHRRVISPTMRHHEEVHETVSCADLDRQDPSAATYRYYARLLLIEYVLITK